MYLMIAFFFPIMNGEWQQSHYSCICTHIFVLKNAQMGKIQDTHKSALGFHQVSTDMITPLQYTTKWGTFKNIRWWIYNRSIQNTVCPFLYHVNCLYFPAEHNWLAFTWAGLVAC